MTDTPATISTHQMRQLHALLRDHGITTDKAVHAYLEQWCAEHDVPVLESRSDLTTEQAAYLISDLQAAAVTQTTVDQGLTALRAPFPDQAIGKLPRSTCRDCSKSQRKRCDQHQWISQCEVCRGRHSSATMHIDYVGHADVTARLLQVDPSWTWEPMGLDPSGMPLMTRDGGLWIRLTVLGVTRPGYGDGENGKGPKEAIGDALRNAAMRFGVALELWAKGDRDWAHADKTGTDQHPDDAQPPSTSERGYEGPDTATLLAQIDADAARVGKTYAEVTAKFREQAGLTLDDLDTIEPWRLASFAARVHEHADKVAAEQRQAAVQAADPQARDADDRAAAEAAVDADPRTPTQQLAEGEAQQSDPWA